MYQAGSGNRHGTICHGLEWPWRSRAHSSSERDTLGFSARKHHGLRQGYQSCEELPRSRPVLTGGRRERAGVDFAKSRLGHRGAYIMESLIE